MVTYRILQRRYSAFPYSKEITVFSRNFEVPSLHLCVLDPTSSILLHVNDYWEILIFCSQMAVMMAVMSH